MMALIFYVVFGESNSICYSSQEKIRVNYYANSKDGPNEFIDDKNNIFKHLIYTFLIFFYVSSNGEHNF